jgi:hypothetical protein
LVARKTNLKSLVINGTAECDEGDGLILEKEGKEEY